MRQEFANAKDKISNRPQLVLKTELVVRTALAIVVIVSIYDAALVLENRDSIVHNERNPVCAVLINLDPNYFSCFLLGKLAGNLAVISVISGLVRCGYSKVVLVSVSVAVFQLFLVVYLHLADPLSGFLSFDYLFSHSWELVKRSLRSLAIHVTGLTAMVALAILVVRKSDLVNRVRVI